MARVLAGGDDLPDGAVLQLFRRRVAGRARPAFKVVSTSHPSPRGEGRVRGGAILTTGGVAMKTTDVRRSLVAAGLVAALLATWPSPAFPQGKRGGVLTFALYQEPETLNPYIATQTASFEVDIFSVEGLLGVNSDGEYFPLLAKEVPSRQNSGVSDDGRTITYHLKDNLKWSDGHPVTCDDVRFTWQAIVNPKSGAVSTTGYRDIEMVDCPTPAAVVVRYKSFYAPFLSRFDYIMPAHATGVKISSAPSPFAERLVLNLADPSLDGPPADQVEKNPHPILGDPKVREAIELGINKKEIIDKLLFGLAVIGTNELHIGWARCATKPSEYDPARARQLLDQAGWKVGADGIRVAQGAKYAKDGTRLRLKLQTTTGNKLREQVEQLLIDYMKQIGLEFFIENVPSPVLFGSWASGAFRKH